MRENVKPATNITSAQPSRIFSVRKEKNMNTNLFLLLSRHAIYILTLTTVSFGKFLTLANHGEIGERNKHSSLSINNHLLTKKFLLFICLFTPKELLNFLQICIYNSPAFNYLKSSDCSQHFIA